MPSRLEDIDAAIERLGTTKVYRPLSDTELSDKSVDVPFYISKKMNNTLHKESIVHMENDNIRYKFTSSKLFFNESLDSIGSMLGFEKTNIPTQHYINLRDHYDKDFITDYCIRDVEIVVRLVLLNEEMYRDMTRYDTISAAAAHEAGAYYKKKYKRNLIVDSNKHIRQELTGRLIPDPVHTH